LAEALDKFGERAVPSGGQSFDRLGEIALTPPEPPLPEPLALPTKRTRKKGAGRPRALTDDEITRGQEIVRSALHQSPKLARKSNDDLAKHFRPLIDLKPPAIDPTLGLPFIRP